jgi:hypothetical protein
MLKVFENTAPKKLFEPKRKKVIGDWSKFHYEELPDLYSSKKYNSM